MERSHTLCSVPLLRLLLSAPLLLALAAPLAAETQVQKTDKRLEQAEQAVDAVTKEPGAALGGIHGGVTGGPVGLAIEGKRGYDLAETGEVEKEQQRQLTEAERQKQLAERERERQRQIKEAEEAERHKHKKHRSPDR